MPKNSYLQKQFLCRLQKTSNINCDGGQIMITQQWIKENVCATCGMVITNRWDNHRIYKECEKELAKKKAK